MLTPNVPDRQHVIPAGLAHHKRFIFSDEQKRPCDFNGVPCDPHDPTKQLTIEQLKSSPCWTNFYYGIGIVLHEDDGLFCVDPDKCIDEHGNLSPLAHEMLARFPGAYVETSVSGRGLHIFGRARVADHHTRAPGFEAYSRRRYIRLTGTLLLGHTRGDPNLNFTGAFSQLLTDYRLWHTAALEPAPVVSGYDGPRLDLGATGGQYSNDELIRIMLDVSGSGAAAFGDAAHPRDLWNADPAALARHYPQEGRGYDWTRAAAALVYHLMFFTGGHESRTLELFRLSGLYRDEDDIRKLALPVGRAGATLTRVYHVPRPGASSGMVLPPPPGAQVEFPALIDAAYAITQPIEPLEWTVQDWFQHKAVNLFGGDGGGGKTTLALQLSAAAAGMKMWLGNFVMPRRVLFVSGEDTGPRVVRMIKRVAERMGHDASNIKILSLDGYLHRTLVNVDRNGIVTPTATLEQIVNIVREHGITMIVFDPVANIWDGNEIDRSQVTSFLSIIRNRFAEQLGCTVILNAHPSRDSMKDGTGYSGSSAWNSSVKSRLYLKIDDSDKNKRILTLAKSNDAMPGQQILMTWKDGWFTVNEGETVTTNVDDVFMAILTRRFKVGMYVSPNRSNNYAPVVFARDEHAGNITKNEFEKSMIRLLESGKIEKIKNGPPSKSTEIIVPKLSSD